MGPCAADGRWHALPGQVVVTMSADERIEQARLLYERFIFGGDASGLAIADRELDAVEADLAMARGRVIHGRFLERRNEDPGQPAEDPRELAFFERAAHLYQALGDPRGGHRGACRRPDRARERLEESVRIRREI